MKRAMRANRTRKHDYLMSSSPVGSKQAMWPIKTYYNHMKKILPILLLSLFTVTLFAQSEISVQSFRKLYRDMTAKIEIPKFEGDKLADSDKPKMIDKAPKEIANSYSTEYYKYKKRKSFWLVSELVTGAAGTVSYLQFLSGSIQEWRWPWTHLYLLTQCPNLQ